MNIKSDKYIKILSSLKKMMRQREKETLIASTSYNHEVGRKLLLNNFKKEHSFKKDLRKHKQNKNVFIR